MVDSSATLIAAAEQLHNLPIVFIQKGKALGDGSPTLIRK